jgi:phenylpropionate dioxygenase-like ring-hydroxylating dioxygenase large terminal subunit
MPEPMTFVRDQWYVVASTDEITGGPLARTVCGEHLVLFRQTDDTIVALTDRCPHRGFPLSLGDVVGDEIQCGYHGLKFDACGTCTWAPLQTNIPSRANVAVYPLAIIGPWVWVWIGDPSAPDMTKLTELPWLDDPEWAVVHGMEPLAARHSLLIDNLLDLSHESYLHAGSIGTPEVAITPIETSVDEAAGVVYVGRHMQSVECPPFYSDATGLSTPIDRWQDIEYHPVACYILHSRVAAAGVAPLADGSDPDAAHLKVLYAITPVDEHNTMDFWALARDFSLDDAEVDDFLTRMNREVILQDVRALDLLEIRMSAESESTEVSLKIDTGALAARRMIARLAGAAKAPAH